MSHVDRTVALIYLDLCLVKMYQLVVTIDGQPLNIMHS